VIFIIRQLLTKMFTEDSSYEESRASNQLCRRISAMAEHQAARQLPGTLGTEHPQRRSGETADIDQLLEARKIVSVEQLIDEANLTTDDFSQ
jgi:hypothetical protein